MRKMMLAAMTILLLVFLAAPVQAGYNELRVMTDGKGAVVYTGSTGKKQAGILYNGYVTSLSLEDENGLYSCWLTRDITVWVDQEKAQDGWPEEYWQMTMEAQNAYPCQMFVAEVTQQEAPVYTSPSHKHLSATHAKGTLLRVCGEFGDDYFVEGWHGDGFIPKEAVGHYAPLTRAQMYDSNYGLEGLEKCRVYTGGGKLAIGNSATGYSDEDAWVVKDGQGVTVLRRLDGWAQLAGGGFIETRFLDPDGDHTIRYATVKSTEILDRLNVRWEADKDSIVEAKLCSGAKVQVPCHTEEWAVVYVTGTEKSEMIAGSAMMEYLVFDDAPVKDGCTKVRLTKTMYAGNGGRQYRSTWTGDPLPAGTEVTVIGVEDGYDIDWDNCDRFICLTEEGRVITVWNDEGVLEPLEGTGVTVRTNTSVRMREMPNKEADTLRTLSKGTKVDVLLRGEGWTMVKYKDQTGYVMSRYLNFP